MPAYPLILGQRLHQDRTTAVVPIFTPAPAQGLALRDCLETRMTYTEIPPIIIAKKKKGVGERWGFPGGSVVKNLPATAGDTGSIPDPGRSHASRIYKAHVSQLLSLRSGAREPQPLSPRTETTEPTRPRARACNQRSLCNEKPRIGPARSPQLEENLHTNEDPAQQKKKQIN